MKRLKKFLSIFVIFIFCLNLISCNNISNNSSDKSTSKNTSSQLKVHFIDVGQADSILIQQGDENMLIDAGNNDDEETLKNYLNDLGITKFKYLVGTHPHEDHIGSLDFIIKSFDIDTLYLPKANATTRTFENVVNAAKNKNLNFTAPKSGDTFKLGSANCTVLAPNSSTYEDTNNYSIVIKVEFGENSFLFTGDAEEISEKEILDKKFDVKADVLKVGHHGSSSSTSNDFLNAVNPKYAVISLGKGNDYGHPHKEALEKLNNKNIQIYRTDESGTIVAMSDGKNISFIKGTHSKSTSKSSTNSTVEDESKDTDKNAKTSSSSSKSSKSSNSNSKVWVSSDSAKVYHKDKSCSGMTNPKQYTLKEAQDKGLKPCSKCAE